MSGQQPGGWQWNQGDLPQEPQPLTPEQQNPQPQYGVYDPTLAPPASNMPPPPEYPTGQWSPQDAQGGQFAGFSGPSSPYSAQSIQPGIIPLHPLTIGEILNGAFAALRAHPGLLFGVSLIVWSIIAALQAAITYIFFPDSLKSFDPETMSSGATEDLMTMTQNNLMSSAVSGVIIGVATLILTGLFMNVVAALVIGKKLSGQSAWEKTKPQLWRIIVWPILTGVLSVLAVTVLGGLMVLVGAGISTGSSDALGSQLALLTVLLIGLPVIGIATVFFAVRLAFVVPVIVLENQGIFASVKRSWTMTKGFFFRLLGIGILVQLLLAALMMAWGFLIGIVGMAVLLATSATGLFMAISTFLNTLIVGLFTPFHVAALGITYIDIRMRREGLGNVLLRASQEN
ncbi:MAG: glycerophosphoryl diester phosphodiesterase membrane domain-containing protein [Actinomycetaceae bacterium]|nr:glycerophosphoryl diester phosphodiesterase membrane domain-containing protein [Actinomycetaceae bacterium]